MIRISTKIHGMKGVRSFAGVNTASVTPMVNRAMEEITRNIAATARALAPAGRTGKLKRSIRAVEVEPTKWRIIAGNRKAFYARFVEFGTRRSRAVPFLRPAFEAYREKIAERIGKAIKAGLKAGARGRSRTPR